MMDAKEALKELEDLTVDYGDRNEEQIARLDEAIDMAMDALRAQAERTEKHTETHACDLIDRQAAIDALNVGAEVLRRVLDDADIVGAERSKYEWGLGLIEANISDMKELPSAQPEKRTGKRTETHSCDLISRQAAIDICNNAIDLWHGQLGEGIVIAVKKKIKELPSAQPEMIREIRKWINSGNRGNADYFIVEKIEEIINKYE